MTGEVSGRDHSGVRMLARADGSRQPAMSSMRSTDDKRRELGILPLLRHAIRVLTVTDRFRLSNRCREACLDFGGGAA
jgi:hypothetical protein